MAWNWKNSNAQNFKTLQPKTNQITQARRPGCEDFKEIPSLKSDYFDTSKHNDPYIVHRLKD